MNEIMNKQQTISSMEVAEMIEKEHRNLVRDIRRYSKQMVSAQEIGDRLKIEPIDFWIESSYVDGRNRSKPCYLITKKGCEFIANKATGTKGTIFTARYINRFHEMEAKIQFDKISMAKREFVSEIPRKSSNSYVLPPANKWYHKNKDKLYYICEKLNITMKEMYRGVLWYLGQEYDLDAANEIYYKRTGIHPKYPMNMVSFFPELEMLADEFLQMVLNKI